MYAAEQSQQRKITQVHGPRSHHRIGRPQVRTHSQNTAIHHQRASQNQKTKENHPRHSQLKRILANVTRNEVIIRHPPKEPLGKGNNVMQKQLEPRLRTNAKQSLTDPSFGALLDQTGKLPEQPTETLGEVILPFRVTMYCYY